MKSQARRALASRLSATVLVAALLFALLVTACGKDDSITQAEKSASAKPGISETKGIAEDGYVYGLPIVMSYLAMYQQAVDRDSGQFRAPFNKICNATELATPGETAVVTPNSDTPYSVVWMDLRAEPLVLSVPAVEKSRYYSVQLCDSSTFNYGYIGSRATGAKAGDYLVAGPDWTGEIPSGIAGVFHSSTQFSLALYRTQVFDPADMPNVIAIQAGYKVRPLSAYLKKAAPLKAPAVDFPKIDKDLIKDGFFSYLDFMLQFAPAGPEEADIRAELARIGVGPGKEFDLGDLSLAHKAEVEKGMKDGESKVEQYLAGGVKSINGWQISSFFGDRAFYNGDWLKRAAGTKGGLFGNDAAEAVYPATKSLANGDALDGSKHTYTLTFAKGQLPPVEAFWSVTMYDGETQLLVDNPIDRYLVNSRMLAKLKKNADGSLTIYIQKDSPGSDKQANWLPAPDGPIFMVMRLYWPRQEAPSILPAGTGTWSPPAIVQAE